MFEQNAPHFFYGERMPLTGVPGADDEFRFHPVEMGASVANDTIIAQCGIAITLDRDNRMTGQLTVSSTYVCIAGEVPTVV